MLINLHTHVLEKAHFQLLNNFLDKKIVAENVPQSLGIHPWFITENWKNDFLFLQKNYHQKYVFAIGEIGLDKMCATDFELQKEVFLHQIQWAEQLQKPIIIHCVKAFEEIMLIKKQSKSTVNWVFHGFSKKTALANQVLKEGFFLSFGHALFTNQTAQKTFQEVPLSRIFLETDDSVYTIEEIYSQASQLKNVSLDFLEKQIEENFKQLMKQ